MHTVIWLYCETQLHQRCLCKPPAYELRHISVRVDVSNNTKWVPSVCIANPFCHTVCPGKCGDISTPEGKCGDISTPEGRAAEGGTPEGRAVSVTRELDLSLLCRI